MKQNRKQELTAKKHIDIYNDFVKGLRDGKAPEAIYEKLSNKYYLDNETIYRIVLTKSGKSRKRNVDG